ncbi:hypothetical protein vseg_011317 [Gypsophila vaccaria]
MSVVWKRVKNSLNCKTCKTQLVYEPTPIMRRSWSRSSSRSCKSTMSDVIYSNKRVRRNLTNCSPMSIRSSDLINPVTHNVRFSGSGLKVDSSDCNVAASPRFGPSPDHGSELSRVATGGGTRGGGYRPEFCNKCGESLARQDGEMHHLSKHAVIEVPEGDSTRKIIEMIFETGWTRTSMNRITIDTILKVNNPETKLAQFEDHREMVKIRAHKLQHSKKHPRCLADGNELLRFYGTTIACSLGQNGTSSLCNLQICRVCGVLRHGFLGHCETDKSVLGIYTTSTSQRAYKSIELEGNEAWTSVRKALILCRVIAGRVHKPLVDSNSQELIGGRRSSGFDSFAGKLGSNGCHIDELYVLKATAILPCFVIVCK